MPEGIRLTAEDSAVSRFHKMNYSSQLSILNKINDLIAKFASLSKEGAKDHNLKSPFTFQTEGYLVSLAFIPRKDFFEIRIMDLSRVFRTNSRLTRFVTVPQ